MQAGLICSALSDDNRTTHTDRQTPKAETDHSFPWVAAPPQPVDGGKPSIPRQTLISFGICTSPAHTDWPDRWRRPTQTGSGDAHLPSSPKCARNHASLGGTSKSGCDAAVAWPNSLCSRPLRGTAHQTKRLSSPQIPQTNPTGRCLAIISWPNPNVACSGARLWPPIRRAWLDLAA
jgi:hypothetical protein